MSQAPRPTPDEAEARRADHVTVSGCSCGQCGHVIVWLRDEAGKAFACAPFPPGGATRVALMIAAEDEHGTPAGHA